MFGGKPFYLSVTFWGLLFYGVGDMLTWICGHGIIPVGICTVISGIMQPLGTILAFLGIRRAQNK